MLTDFHIHSDCSPDGFDSAADMARACAERGVELICFTDHCDLDWYETGEPDPHCFNHWPRALEQYSAAQNGSALPLIRTGIELGEPCHDAARAERIASSPELDFVLGSLHSLRGERDFFCLRYESRGHCIDLMHRYFAELTEMARLPFIDVIAHIGYTRRYMMKAGFDIRADMTSFGDEIDLLLKTAIENGIGIEVNTSGLRNSLVGSTIPGADVIRRYRELGGELITLGSDAHRAADAGGGLAEGLELIKQSGFRYITVFNKRKPEFIRIQEEK